MLFQRYAEGNGATLRELQEGSLDQLIAQLHPGEMLFGVAEGVREEVPFDLQLAFMLLGLRAVPEESEVAMPVSDEEQYLRFIVLVHTKKPTRHLFYAVSGLSLDQPPSFSSRSHLN